MKKPFFILTGVFLISAFGLRAQSRLPGRWEGDLEVNASRTIRVQMNIRKEPHGALSATLDDPARKVYGAPCDTTILRGDSLFVSIALAHANFAGKVNADATEISGFWMQKTFIAPLTLRKKDRGEPSTRPQMPVPPFDYVSEDVEYDDAGHKIHFGATLTRPPGTGPFPAALLITGSGQQDRDETMLGHKPFAVIADYLTQRGFAVLRVDDRGAGKTTGNFGASTTADFAADASASFDYLITRPEIDVRKAGLIGHSEGGMIANMIAARRPDVAFVVLLAAPGVKSLDLLEQQGVDLLKSGGVDSADLGAYRPLYKQMMKVVMDEKDPKAAYNNATRAFKKWQTTAGAEVVQRTTNVTNDSTLRKYITATIRSAASPWYHFFVHYDPVPDLEKISCPVLALDGERDIQVAPKMNLAAIRQGLQKSKSPSYQILELPGLNHLFQTCRKCSYKEYGQLEETFAPAALKIIGDWVAQATK